MNVHLQYRRTNEVVAACLDGEVDFGIVALPARRPQLEIVPPGYDELVVAAPPDHAIARRARCPLAALDGQPFIGFDRDIPTRRIVEPAARTASASTTSWSSTTSRRSSGRSRLASAFARARPTLASEIRARTLVARPPVEGPFRRPVGVIYRRSRELSGAGRAFLALLTAELGSRPVTPKGNVGVVSAVLPAEGGHDLPGEPGELFDHEGPRRAQRPGDHDVISPG